MLRPAVLIKRSLIFIHRWLGVALSALFMLWFCSGIVMMYWGYPGISVKDRLERAPVLDPTQIKVSPEEAYATLKLDEPAGQAQLTSFDGRPIYRFGGAAEFRGGQQRRGRGGIGNLAVYADDGSVPAQVDDAMLDRIVAAWAKRPVSDAKRETVDQVDQWTLEGVNFRAARPLYKYSFNDGQQVYVSGRMADIVQYTTTESRFWAYLGAIPHWLYWTSLRKHQPQWFSLIVWTSGIGTIAALLGVIVAIWMLSPSQKYRYAGAPSSIPYRGWKRWHMILGLFFGVIAVTWVFSGLLSLGPFEFVDWITGNAPRANGRASRVVSFDPDAILRGDKRFDLAAYSRKPPSAALASLGSDFRAKELEFSMFAGEPQYIATDAAGHTRIIPVNGEPKPELNHDRMMGMLRESAGPNLAEIRMMDQYDAYYLDRLRQEPLPVIYVRMNDATRTRYYIDPKTGRTVSAYSSRNWVDRWLYHGLHSLNFPWLYNYRPLWDIVVITLMLGGTAICVTSLVLTYQVLARKLAAILRARTQQMSEDLVLGDQS